MERQPITIGLFTLQVTTDGTAWIAPGGAWIKSERRAEQVAREIAGRVRDAS